jgi:hypothetical protein
MAKMIQSRKLIRDAARRWLALLSLIVLLGGWLTRLAYADATVTPDRIEETLQPGQCVDKTIDVGIGAAPIPKLDVALVIDVTGSMNDEIDEVTQSVEDIADDIRTLVPDTEFALATLSDYPDYGGGDEDDYPWRVDQWFTQDVRRLRNALQSIELQYGGDNPESYLRALYEAQSLDWREGARRVVILFGDSAPHNPDPGRDKEIGTSDDLTQDHIIGELNEDQITVLSVYSSSDTGDFYSTIAEETKGNAYRLNRTAEIPSEVQRLVEETVASIQVLTIEPASLGSEWLQWEPSVYRDVAPLAKREFEVRLCAPDDAKGGDYFFDMEVSGDGALLGSVPVAIHVIEPTLTPSPTPTCTPTPTPIPTPTPTPTPTPWWSLWQPGGTGAWMLPWWLWIIPLLFLLLLLLYFLWWTRRPTTSSPVSAPGQREGHTQSKSKKPKKRTPSQGQSITHGRPPKPPKRD